MHRRQPSGEHAPLLGHGATTATRTTLRGLGALATVVLCLAATVALVQVSLTLHELRTHLAQVTPAMTMPTTTTTLGAMTEPPLANLNDPSAVELPSTPSDHPRVLVVYSNGTHLRQLARAIEAGARAVIAEPQRVRVRLVQDASFTDDVLWADAIVLGSHVVNANVEPAMTAFLSSWDFSQDLSHKVGAAFVTGGGLSAGEELTMVNLLHSLLIFRMIIVGGERWTAAFGASAIVGEGPFTDRTHPKDDFHGDDSACSRPRSVTDPTAIAGLFKDKALGLGRRIATVASALRRPDDL